MEEFAGHQLAIVSNNNVQLATELVRSTGSVPAHQIGAQHLVATRRRSVQITDDADAEDADQEDGRHTTDQSRDADAGLVDHVDSQQVGERGIVDVDGGHQIVAVSVEGQGADAAAEGRRGGHRRPVVRALQTHQVDVDAAQLQRRFAVEETVPSGAERGGCPALARLGRTLVHFHLHPAVVPFHLQLVDVVVGQRCRTVACNITDISVNIQYPLMNMVYGLKLVFQTRKKKHVIL